MRDIGKRVVVVHPDDVNLADVKAMAAEYDTSVVGNPYCPRGKAFLIDAAALELPDHRDDEGRSGARDGSGS